MAPRSPEDPHDDRVARREPDSTPARPAGDVRPARSERPRDAATPAEQVDFGDFVSRSVRSSADRLKGGASRRASGAATPPTQPTQPSRPSQPRRERSSRYWRDSFRERSGEEVSVETGARRFLDASPGRGAEGGGGEAGGRGGQGGNGGAWWQSLLSGGDGQGPDRRLIGAIVGGVLLLLLLVFLIPRLGGGDDGDVTPTPPATSVLEQPVSTPGATESVQQPTPSQTETQAEPAPTIRRGGDNQRQPTEDGTPGARREGGALAMDEAEYAYGPVANSCPKACLVRLTDVDDPEQLYADTGSRPSFEADGVSWLVSSTDQIAYFESRQASVEMVRKSAETLALYVVEVPDDGDEALVAEFGTVLDVVGSLQLLEADHVPAQVRGLTDAGFNVQKLAPATAAVTQAPVEQTSLADVEIGSLMGEVTRGNVEETISTLQGIGSGEGQRLGTRYYTLAGNQMAADYLYQQLESYGLTVWYEDFLTPEGILLVNVVAEIPGRDRSAIYGVMAHFDSLAAAPGTAPGADDNATGVAASLEIARVLAGYELKYPVRIVFTNAEEVGILGSSVWARMAKTDKLPIEGVFNVDAVGSDRQGMLLVFNSDARSSWMQDLMIRVNDAYGLGNEIMSRQNPQIVADDNKVREQGIEAVLVARELYGWGPIHHTTNDVAPNVSTDNVLSTTYLVLLSVAAVVQ